MAGKGGGKEIVLILIQDDYYTWAHQTSGDKCQQWSNGVVVITECSTESGNIVGIGRRDFGERLFLFTLHPHFSPSLYLNILLLELDRCAHWGLACVGCQLTFEFCMKLFASISCLKIVI